ncbi:MAG: redox-regulated ATPase YchF [Desulfobacterales bacterium]|nr:redox-regulated ATPase YchF [Desulfobacterales bacterium]
MRLAIIGLPGAGKSTVFQALTRSKPEQWAHKGPRIGTVRVPDERVDKLGNLLKPKKTVYAYLEYLLPYAAKAYGRKTRGDESAWNEVRPCDSLIHVVRNFEQPGGKAPQPRDDLLKLESDMIFADLVVVEGRIERIGLDKKRGKKISDEELGLLEACLKVLESERPLRDYPELAAAPLLKGYALLSAKPVMIIFNNDEEDESLPAWQDSPGLANALVVRGKLEMELAELSAEEAEEFLAAYNIESSATDRVIRHSCNLLGLISFFTVVSDEVRCWLIPAETTALDAAGAIHSDMKNGFIRAEVLAYDDLIASGAYQQAKKEAKVRLEAKTYLVQDGDVIYFRFNV